MSGTSFSPFNNVMDQSAIIMLRFSPKIIPVEFIISIGCTHFFCACSFLCLLT